LLHQANFVQEPRVTLCKSHVLSDNAAGRPSRTSDHEPSNFFFAGLRVFEPLWRFAELLDILTGPVTRWQRRARVCHGCSAAVSWAPIGMACACLGFANIFERPKFDVARKQVRPNTGQKPANNLVRKQGRPKTGPKWFITQSVLQEFESTCHTVSSTRVRIN
jgi:hypothetical protein